jgi:hypothetical protein
LFLRMGLPDLVFGQSSAEAGVGNEARLKGSSSVPKILLGEMTARCGNWKPVLSKSRISFLERLVLIFTGQILGMSGLESRLYPLSLCAFDAAFYVVVVEEELHYLWPFLVRTLHNASVCGGCRGFPTLNNLGLVLLLGDSLLGEAGLRGSLGQPCDVPLRLLTSSFMYSSDMTWSPYVAHSA